MTNQKLQDELDELDEMLKSELRDLAFKRKWVRESELKVRMLENNIELTKTELKKQAL